MIQHGVRHVVVCPGSRNSALSHNFSQCPDIICHPATDERSAGFLALGIALHERYSLVAICVTSGSALLNVLPAVAEASYQHCGFIVISADRPAQWIDQLDGQTLPQAGALEPFVSKTVNLPEPRDNEQRWYCNRLINEALIAIKRTHKPVHINIPISEPFFSFSNKELPVERKVDYLDWSSTEAKAPVLRMISNAKRPMMVFGQLPCGIVSDKISNIEASVVLLHEPLSVKSLGNGMTEQMLSVIDDKNHVFTPDLLIYFGHHTVSKRLRHYLRKLPQTTKIIMVDEEGELRDVSMNATMVIHGQTHIVSDEIFSHINNNGISAESQYLMAWKLLRDSVSERHSQFEPAYSSMKAVELLEKSYGQEIIHYANSMSVRLGTLFNEGHYRYCNRGVNGIEGSLSTAAGMSLAMMQNDNPQKIFCVIGDLSFFYDENALWQQQLSGNLRILLLNNNEGGIFRNLKGLEQSPALETIIAAHHKVSAEGICQQFGLSYKKVTSDLTLNEGIMWLGSSESLRPVVLEVITDAKEDEIVLKKYYSNLKNN